MTFRQDRKQVFSIKKYKSIGAASVLLGLLILGPEVQSPFNTVKVSAETASLADLKQAAITELNNNFENLIRHIRLNLHSTSDNAKLQYEEAAKEFQLDATNAINTADIAEKVLDSKNKGMSYLNQLKDMTDKINSANVENSKAEAKKSIALRLTEVIESIKSLLKSAVDKQDLTEEAQKISDDAVVDIISKDNWGHIEDARLEGLKKLDDVEVKIKEKITKDNFDKEKIQAGHDIFAKLKETQRAITEWGHATTDAEKETLNQLVDSIAHNAIRVVETANTSEELATLKQTAIDVLTKMSDLSEYQNNWNVAKAKETANLQISNRSAEITKAIDNSNMNNAEKDALKDEIKKVVLAATNAVTSQNTLDPIEKERISGLKKLDDVEVKIKEKITKDNFDKEKIQAGHDILAKLKETQRAITEWGHATTDAEKETLNQLVDSIAHNAIRVVETANTSEELATLKQTAIDVLTKMSDLSEYQNNWNVAKAKETANLQISNRSAEITKAIDNSNMNNAEKDALKDEIKKVVLAATNAVTSQNTLDPIEKERISGLKKLDDVEVKIKEKITKDNFDKEKIQAGHDILAKLKETQRAITEWGHATTDAEKETLNQLVDSIAHNAIRVVETANTSEELATLKQTAIDVLTKMSDLSEYQNNWNVAKAKETANLQISNRSAEITKAIDNSNMNNAEKDALKDEIKKVVLAATNAVTSQNTLDPIEKERIYGLKKLDVVNDVVNALTHTAVAVIEWGHATTDAEKEMFKEQAYKVAIDVIISVKNSKTLDEVNTLKQEAINELKQIERKSEEQNGFNINQQKSKAKEYIEFRLNEIIAAIDSLKINDARKLMLKEEIQRQAKEIIDTIDSKTNLTDVENNKLAGLKKLDVVNDVVNVLTHTAVAVIEWGHATTDAEKEMFKEQAYKVAIDVIISVKNSKTLDEVNTLKQEAINELKQIERKSEEQNGFNINQQKSKAKEYIEFRLNEIIAAIDSLKINDARKLMLKEEIQRQAKEIIDTIDSKTNLTDIENNKLAGLKNIDMFDEKVKEEIKINNLLPNTGAGSLKTTTLGLFFLSLLPFTIFGIKKRKN